MTRYAVLSKNPSSKPQSRRIDYEWSRLAPPAVALIALSVYLFTLLREVDWWDAAELTLQSYLLGVTHPPGYPVFTLIGKLFTLFIPDPAIATNVMSAVFTGLCVYMLCITALALGCRRSHSVLSSFVFAFIPVIWSIAVTTEVYNVNMFFLAIVFFLLIRWYEEPAPHLVFLAGTLLGISMGTYLANVLILPAFLYLIIARGWRFKSQLILFSCAYVVFGCLAVSLNYFISKINPPFGSLITPDSLKNLFLFVKGDQYGTLNIHSPRYYVFRLLEHGLHFSKNFMGVGIIIGLFGLRAQWKKDPVICRFFLLAFLINMLYFTFFDVKEYYNMVTPSYFVFSIWIAYGIGYFRSEGFSARTRIAAYVVSIGIIAGLIATQIVPRLERSRNTPVTDFVKSSFGVIPESAVIIAPWNEFTPLYYHHRALGARPDIKLVELRNTPYIREHGMIPEWQELLTNQIGSRAIVTYGIPRNLEQSYRFIAIKDNWYQIAPLPAEGEE